MNSRQPVLMFSHPHSQKKKKSSYGNLFLISFQCLNAFSPYLCTAVNSVNFCSVLGQGSLCFRFQYLSSLSCRRENYL